MMGTSSVVAQESAIVNLSDAPAQGQSRDLLQNWLAKLRINMSSNGAPNPLGGSSNPPCGELQHQHQHQEAKMRLQRLQSQRLRQHRAMQEAEQDANGSQPLLPAVPEGVHARKTLVLDLDHTLIDCALLSEPTGEPDFVYTDVEGSQAKVWRRPFLLEFLRAVRQDFEVVLFTAAGKRHADAVLDFVDPDQELFDHRLYAQHTVSAPQWAYVKDLSRLGRDLSRTLIVDDCAAAALRQPANWVSISPFHHDGAGAALDSALMQILKFLREKVLPADDVRAAIAEHYNVPACRPRRSPRRTGAAHSSPRHRAASLGSAAGSASAPSPALLTKNYSLGASSTEDDRAGDGEDAEQNDRRDAQPFTPAAARTCPLPFSTADPSTSLASSPSSAHSSSVSCLTFLSSPFATCGYTSATPGGTGAGSSRSLTLSSPVSRNSSAGGSCQPANTAAGSSAGGRVDTGDTLEGARKMSAVGPVRMRRSSSCSLKARDAGAASAPSAGGGSAPPSGRGCGVLSGCGGSSGALDALVQAPRGLRRVPTVLEDLVTMSGADAMMGARAAAANGALQAPDGVVLVAPPPLAPAPAAAAPAAPPAHHHRRRPQLRACASAPSQLRALLPPHSRPLAGHAAGTCATADSFLRHVRVRLRRAASLASHAATSQLSIREIWNSQHPVGAQGLDTGPQPPQPSPLAVELPAPRCSDAEAFVEANGLIKGALKDEGPKARTSCVRLRAANAADAVGAAGVAAATGAADVNGADDAAAASCCVADALGAAGATGAADALGPAEAVGAADVVATISVPGRGKPAPMPTAAHRVPGPVRVVARALGTRSTASTPRGVHATHGLCCLAAAALRAPRTSECGVSADSSAGVVKPVHVGGSTRHRRSCSASAMLTGAMFLPPLSGSAAALL